MRTNMLCEYKDIAGTPNEGIHSYRIFGLAAVDVTGTLGIAYIIHRYTSIGFPTAALFLLLSSLIVHKLFCVDTTLTKLVFD